MATAALRTIPTEIMTVLANGTALGNRFVLPQQLDRKTYEAANKVLVALGGSWVRGAKAHVFESDCSELLEHAISTGSYQRPDDLGWFPTPGPLARRLVELAGDVAGRVVLEPSAGEGSLAGELLARGAVVRAVEIDPGRAKKLATLIGADNVSQADFLSIEPYPVDLIVANPPFAKRADIHHMNHALRFLKPGGKLVAIMCAGVGFRQDALTQAFRQRMTSIEALPEGSFKSSGTAVNAVIVTTIG